MVDGLLFDKLAAIAVALKKQSLPFGGIQVSPFETYGSDRLLTLPFKLIVTGDFFQLPPVTKGASPNFAFEAKSWRECIHNTVNLTQVFRQKDTSKCFPLERVIQDVLIPVIRPVAAFVDMLNEMRFGTLSAESIAKFQACSRDPRYNDGVDPTELYVAKSNDGVERETNLFKSAFPCDAKSTVRISHVSRRFLGKFKSSRRSITLLQDGMGNPTRCSNRLWPLNDSNSKLELKSC